MTFSFQRFYSIFIARNREFYRDSGALGWTLLFPILIIVAFSFMFKFDGGGIYKAGYLLPKKPTSIPFVEYIGFENNEEGVKKLEHHQLDLFVDANQIPIQYWVNTGSPKSLITEDLLQAASLKPKEKEKLSRKEVASKNLSYVDWLFPGLIAMNVMWMALWGVGWVIVRQRKLGVLKRFKASPLTPLEYLLAQMLSRLIILIFVGVFIFAFAHLIHPFETKGSYLDLLIIYIVGCFSLSSIGLIIASRMSSDEMANGLLNLLSFPMMFLSEIWFSLEGSPDWVKAFAKTMPLWHMSDGMRKIMLEGYSIFQLKGSLLILILISIIFTAIGALSFKWTSD